MNPRLVQRQLFERSTLMGEISRESTRIEKWTYHQHSKIEHIHQQDLEVLCKR